MPHSRQEQRTVPRLQPYVARCVVVSPDAERVPGYLLDLSPRGARVACETAPAAAGQTVWLEIHFQGRLSAAHILGEIKWVRAPSGARRQYALGVRFVLSSPEQRQILEEVVEEFERHAALLR